MSDVDLLTSVKNMDKITNRELQIDHRAVIAGLGKDQRDFLLERSNGPGLVRLVAHWGGILALGALIMAAVPVWPALLVIDGILIVFLFTTLHETIHGTAFRTGRLNDLVAAVSGFMLLLPPLWFRYFHFAHHRHTHDPERDPELATPKPETVAQYAVYISGLPYWLGQVRSLVRNASGWCDDEFVPGKARSKVRDEARFHLAAYASLIVGSLVLANPVLLWVWVVPALLGQPFLRAYLLAEHTLCPHVANMLDNSRTTFTNAVIRFVAWNMPYHAEHHAYPAVPFHRLPEFHAITRDHLTQTERGYHRFHRRLVASFERPEAGRSRPA